MGYIGGYVGLFLGYAILQVPELAKLAHNEVASKHRKDGTKNSITPAKCEKDVASHNNSCSHEEYTDQMMTIAAKGGIYLLLESADNTCPKLKQLQISMVDINRRAPSLLLRMKGSDIYKETRV